MTVNSDIISEDNPISDEEQIEVASTGTEVDKQVEIPGKYQGKSMEEIIAMHQNAEKELSRIGNELGQNRKLVDKLLQTEKISQPVVEEELPDWDYEPEKAAQKLVSKEVGALKSQLEQIKNETALEKFKAKYPGFEEDSKSPEFQSWVQASDYRSNLYMKNYNGIDLVAADELMRGWQDYKSISSEEKAGREAKRKDDLKAATLEKGASSGGSRKKMWSRAYIRHLRLNEPAKYKANYDEIMAAYKEDRVTK